MEETADYLPRKRKKTWMLGLIVPALAILPFWFIFLGPKLRHDRLVEQGIQVPGRLLDVEETGTTVNDSPELKLTVEFTRREGIRDTAVTEFVPRLRSLYLFQPGVGATIAYDSTDPNEITIVDLNSNLPAASAEQLHGSHGINVDSLQRVADSMAAELKKKR